VTGESTQLSRGFQTIIYSGGELTVTREDVPQLRIRLPAAATDDDRETV